MSSAKSHHVRLNSKSSELLAYTNAMTFLNHNNNLLILTLYFPLPSSSVASSAASAPSAAKSAESTTPKKKSFVEIKEEIKKQVDELPGEIEKLKNQSPNDDVTKRLSDCQSKLSALQTVLNLAEFAESHTKTNDNNILNNLCTGLETFLGFDPTAKGYTGQGIVYSDLDRLCDGVMGFLSGVLGAVKDDDAVKTYDNYFTDDTEKLKSVLKLVDSKIGSGRAGLAVSVDVVKAWLEGYDKNLRTSTYLVTHELDGLKELISGKRVYGIHDVQSLQDQLKTWTGVVEKIDEHVKQNIITNVDKLDDALQRSVMNKIDSLSASINLFLDSAKDPAVIQQVKKVDTELQAQELKIKDALGNEVYELRDSVKDLRKKRIEEFKTIFEQLDTLKHFLDQDFELDHKTAISQKFDEIETALNNLCHELTARRVRLADSVRKAQVALRTLKNRVGDNTATGNADNDSMAYTWEKIKWQITRDAGDVTNKINGHLDKIMNGIRNYNVRFYQHGAFMTQTLQRWLDDIVEDPRVSSLLSSHAWSGSHKRTVEKAIKDHIKRLISGLATTIESYKIPEGMDKRLTHIHGFFEQLAGKMDSSKSEEMARDVHSRLLSRNGGLLYVNQHEIEPAITAISSALCTTAKYINEELKSFTVDQTIDYNLGSQISKAIGGIEKLKQHVDSSSGSTYQSGLGKKIDDALGAVRVNIKELGHLLDGTDGIIPDAVGKLKDEFIAELDTIVQDNQQGTIRKKQNEANAKLGDLKTKLNEKLTSITSSVIEADTIIDKAINAILDTLNEAHNIIEKCVTNAFANVTREIRTLFAEGHKADLEALHKCVEKQLPAVKEIIRVDGLTSIKGLMKKMNEHRYTLDQIKTLIDPETVKAPVAVERFTDVAYHLKDFQDTLLRYIKHQLCISSSDLSKKPEPTKDSQMISTVNVRLDALLDYLKNKEATPIVTDLNIKRIYTYDEACSRLLDLLRDSINTFSSPSPLLAPLKAGLSNFAQQLGHAYVSRYSGVKMGALTELKKPSDQSSGKQSTQTDNYDLTPEGRNCAKVCLTIVEILVNDFEKLFTATAGNKNAQINVYNGNKLGVFFRTRGYDVAKGASTQDGELQNSRDMTGSKIRGLCENSITVRNSGEYDPKTQQLQAIDRGVTTFDRWIRYLYVFLSKYRSVCHIKHIAKPRTPTTINQMLHWVDGLPYTTVYNEFTIQGFGELFEKPEEEESVEGEIVLKTEDDDKLEAYPDTITAAKLRDTLTDVCRFSDRVLVCILGHGHAEGRYACDFSTNPDGLLYPSNASACLDMLVDILKRLYEQFYFLFIQCSRDKDNVSWRDCWYGRHVGGSDWRCNEKQCINQMVNQSADQKDNQSCGQTCDRHPSCGLKSPLQSFLEDGLPGFLPHSIKKPGCKLDCTVSNHRGLPCKTPMGFGDISVTASRASRGERLMKLLDVFCGQQTSPLTKLCGYFNCLLQMPPQTLGDMFAFYHNLLVDWNGAAKGLIDGPKHKKSAFVTAVRGANFGVEYPELDVSTLFFTFKHTSDISNGDLLCLLSCGSASLTTTCGRYLQPFGMNTWTVFAQKHADKYLSWIVYLTETFYSLLEKLLEECCQNCTSTQSRCNGKVCPKTCKVKYTSDETKPQPVADVHHTKDCKSIAYCPSTRPTLCKYGFVFKSLSNMSGTSGDVTKRTCKDLCHALQNVLLKGKVLGEFTHVTIPKFLWNIRSKFFWLNVALWSASFLYLIYVMVGRLDLLHIKSHLRSPSSHRITAQSLLAAAQVGRLAKISYLQP